MEEVDQHLPESFAALFAASLLFFLPREGGRPAMDWHEAAKVDWGTILLFGSGFNHAAHFRRGPGRFFWLHATGLNPTQHDHLLQRLGAAARHGPRWNLVGPFGRYSHLAVATPSMSSVGHGLKTNLHCPFSCNPFFRLSHFG
jgi:hypothetical protein